MRFSVRGKWGVAVLFVWFIVRRSWASEVGSFAEAVELVDLALGPHCIGSGLASAEEAEKEVCFPQDLCGAHKTMPLHWFALRLWSQISPDIHFFFFFVHTFSSPYGVFLKETVHTKKPFSIFSPSRVCAPSLQWVECVYSKWLISVNQMFVRRLDWSLQLKDMFKCLWSVRVLFVCFERINAKKVKAKTCI